MNFQIGDRVKPASTFDLTQARGPETLETLGTVIGFADETSDYIEGGYQLILVKWDEGPYGPYWGEEEDTEGAWDHLSVDVSKKLHEASEDDYFLTYAVEKVEEAA